MGLEDGQDEEERGVRIDGMECLDGEIACSSCIILVYFSSSFIGNITVYSIA